MQLYHKMDSKLVWLQNYKDQKNKEYSILSEKYFKLLKLSIQYWILSKEISNLHSGKYNNQ